MASEFTAFQYSRLRRYESGYAERNGSGAIPAPKKAVTEKA
jgi:hypothetical protein